MNEELSGIQKLAALSFLAGMGAIWFVGFFNLLRGLFKFLGLWQ
jgi:hypothetical protein